MNDDTVNAISQDIISTLDSLKNISEQKQIDSIFLTYQAFHQLINYINNESNPFFARTLETIKDAIKVVQSLIYFCSNKENNEKLSLLINEFIRSSLFAPKLKTEFAALANSYLYCNFSCSACIPLLQFIEDFFSNQLFCSAFEKVSGLSSIFNILIDEKKSGLCHKVVNSIYPNLKYYYLITNKANEFLAKSIDILPMIPFINSSATFKLLFHFTISHKPPVMSYFITEKFENINDYILSDKEGNLLFIYSIFFDIMNYQEHSEFIHPLSIHLLNLINNSNSCPNVKKNALATLKVLLVHFSETLPIDINLIYSICCHISSNDIPSILIFLDIIKYISIHFKTNKILLASAIHPFVTKENALNSDINDAFEVMLNLDSEFVKCASSFIVPLVKDSTPQELEKMLTKYPLFLTLFHNTIHDFPFKRNDVSAIKLFLESDIYKTKPEQFGKSMIKMLKKELFFPYVVPKLTDMDKFYLELLFDYAGKACRNDIKLKRNWYDNEIIKIVCEIVSNKLISIPVYLDFIASLSPVKFNAKFDKLIFDFFEKNDYFNQSEESIKKLAFGRLQSENLEDSFLVLPSILYKCGNFKVKFPSDLYLSSKYSIDIWSDKTNKTVDEFPSIDTISRRYILPHHFDDLFHSIINEIDYDNFLNYMSNEIDYIPLIEFHRNVPDTFIYLTLKSQNQNNDTFSFSISIWFYFSHKFESENQIFSISDFTINVNNTNTFILRCNNNNNNIKSEEKNIGEFEEKTWINLIVCYGINSITLNNEYFIYINSVLKCSLKSNTIPNGVTFGSFNPNDQTWFIGGYIRIINDLIQQSTINNIYNLGVFPPPLHLKNERPLILVTDINPPPDSNVRFAPSCSFLKQFGNSIGQSNGFCGKILKLISNRNERNEIVMKKLFYSMILNQYLNRSQKLLPSFTLNLSVLANLKTNLFDSPQIFDLINKCFVKVNSVNWEPFFTFYLDLNFIEKDFIIEKIIKFIESYRSNFDSNKTKFQDSVFRFYFESICLCSKKINFKLIFKLLSFFDQNSNNLCVYLSSLHTFYSFRKKTKNLEENEEINKFNQNELCKYLIQEMNSKIITEFKDLFILDLVPSDYSLEFCFILLSIQPKIQRLIDKKKIMSFCFSNINKMRAWDCAMTLLICSPISFETNLRIEYDTLDITIIPMFLIMLGALFSVAHNFEENSKWKKMTFTIISFIESIMENFGHNDQTVFSMMQLVYFNTFIDTEFLFPFAPGLKKIEEIANVSVTRSQEFPKSDGFKYEESKLKLLVQKEKCIEYIDNIFPKKIQMIPPYLSKEIEFDSPFEDDFSCNYDVKWNSLREYVHDAVRLFGFDDVKVDENYLSKIRVSKITSDVLDLLSKYLFIILEETQETLDATTTTSSSLDVQITNSNINLSPSLSQNSTPIILKPSLISFSSSSSLLQQQQNNNNNSENKSDSLFLSYLKSFTLSSFRIHPSHALFVSQRIILSLLTECINQSVFSLELIDFACERAREGWFANQVAPLISLVISICQITGQSNLPHSIYSLLILGFEITPFNQFPIYSEIYLTYQNLIFNDISCRDPNLYLMFIDYILKYNHVVPETFSRIWHLIFINMTKYQLNLKEKWPNGMFDLNYKFVCLIEKDGFSFISKNKDDDLFQQFCTEKKRLITHFIEEQYYTVIHSMKLISSYLYNRNGEFKIFIRDLLNQVQTNIQISNVVGDVIHERLRKITLLDFDLFYRIREKHITKHQQFEHFKGKGSSLIVLGNQLFPSKRVEKSVIYVNQNAELLSQMIPKNLIIENDDYIINANEIILNNFSFDFYPISNILYSKEQIGILLFSQRLPISESYLYKSFEILNDKIEFSCDASFLYGIEPLNGTIVKNSHSLIFIEGLKIISLKESSNEIESSEKVKYRMKFVNQQNISPFAFNFYMNYFIAGYFGPCSLFCGHPLLKWNISDIVNIIQKNKGKSDTDFEYEFNFICGWNFIIRANLQEILVPLLNSSLPFISQALSLLRKDVSSASELWTKGLIDNYSYLCYLNMMSGRSYCTFSNYPVFPQIYDDFNEQKLRDYSKTRKQMSEEKSGNLNEKQLLNASFVYSFFRKFDPYRFLLFSFLKKKKVQSPTICQFNLHKSLEPLKSFDEVVPHFYLVPELCKRFMLPQWCCVDSKSNDFVFRSQILIQSDEVTVGLSNWIDLNFGYLFNPSEKGILAIQLFKKLHEKRQISAAQNQLNTESSSIENNENNENLDQDQKIGGYSLSFGLFGLHLLTNPELIVVQSLNPSMFKNPISELIINNDDSSVISMKPLTVFVTPTNFLALNTVQGCLLRNGNTLIATSYLFAGAINFSIAPDRYMCAVTGNEGIVSLWRIKYEGIQPVGCSMVASFQIKSSIDSELFQYDSKSGVAEGEDETDGSNNKIELDDELKDDDNSNFQDESSSFAIPPLKRSNSNTQLVTKIDKSHSTARKLSTPAQSPTSLQTSSPNQASDKQTPNKGRVVFSALHFLAIIACNDQIVRFDLGRNRLVTPINTGYQISCIAVDDQAGHIISCGDRCFSLWTISGSFVYSQTCGVRVCSVAVARQPIYVRNRFIVTGHDDGFLLFWSFDPKVGVIQNLAQRKLTSNPITAISIDNSSMRVVASSQENEVFCLDFTGTERNPINRDFAFMCPNCHLRFDVSKGTNKNRGNQKVCTKCKRYFCNNCVIALPRRLIQMATKEFICEFCASCLPK